MFRSGRSYLVLRIRLETLMKKELIEKTIYDGVLRIINAGVAKGEF